MLRDLRERMARRRQERRAGKDQRLLKRAQVDAMRREAKLKHIGKGVPAPVDGVRASPEGAMYLCPVGAALWSMRSKESP